MKKKVRVFIERSKDGSYSAYMPDDNNLSYGIIGEGNTIEDAFNDFIGTYEDMRKVAKENDRPFEGVIFKFSYETSTLL